MSQFDLSGKRVLVSGSARGLGAGMAEAMTAIVLADHCLRQRAGRV